MIVDLGAGAGGWSEALRSLGLESLGIDIDPTACATAQSAGHERIVADMREVDPRDYGQLDGVIASVPCPTWSLQGKHRGIDKPTVIACAQDMADGRDTRADRAGECFHEDSMLVIEPLRWAFASYPRWIALEQVPPVLEVWTLFAHLLAQAGYRCWAGTLKAERFGVPQTRERAILLAHREQAVSPPTPTHRAWWPPNVRTPREEKRLPPPITMAAALGLEEGDPDVPEWAYYRPAPTISTSRGGVGGRRSRRHQEKHIMLSHHECAKLQTFRDDYPWHGNSTDRHRQIGNAVPPLLAAHALSQVVF